MSPKTNPVPKWASTGGEAMINEIVLEGMMAGLFEVCLILKPGPLGRKMLAPLEKTLHKSATAGICRAVFRYAGRETLTQETFLLCFMEVLRQGKGEFAKLGKELDRPGNVTLIKQMARYLGVRFATLFCLMGLRIMEVAGEKGLLCYRGCDVEMATSV